MKSPKKDSSPEPSSLENHLFDVPEPEKQPPHTTDDSLPHHEQPPAAADHFIPLDTHTPAQDIDTNIHFIYDELKGTLDKDMHEILFRINHPLVGKHLHILNTFVTQVAYALAQKHKPSPHQTQQPLPEERAAPPSPLPVFQQPRIEKRRVIQPPRIITPLPAFTASALTPETPPLPPQPSITEIKIIHVPLVIDENTHAVVARADIEGNKYAVIEPTIDPVITKLLIDIKPQITNPALLKNERALSKIITKTAKKLSVDYDDEDFAIIRYYLNRDLLHLGIVRALMNDKKITKIICEGQGIPLSIIREDKKFMTTITFPGKEELNTFILDVAQKTYQKVTLDDPVLDATYKDFRIEGTLGTEIVPSRFIMTRLII